MAWKIAVEERDKSRGDYLVNTGRNKEGWMEGGINADFTKGCDLIFPVEIWDGISWELRREGERGAQCTSNILTKFLGVH